MRKYPQEMFLFCEGHMYRKCLLFKIHSPLYFISFVFDALMLMSKVHSHNKTDVHVIAGLNQYEISIGM